MSPSASILLLLPEKVLLFSITRRTQYLLWDKSPNAGTPHLRLIWPDSSVSSPTVIGQPVWVEQTGSDNLSWGSWDCEQGRHRLHTHQSQRKLRNQQRIRYWYGNKGSPCTRLTAGFLEITKAFLDAGMQVLQDSFFSFFVFFAVVGNPEKVKGTKSSKR